MTGHERSPDEKRFSDRVFDRAALAFAVGAVQTRSLGDDGYACTAPTTDNEGRFSFSGVNVGVGHCQVRVKAFSHSVVVFVGSIPTGLPSTNPTGGTVRAQSTKATKICVLRIFRFESVSGGNKRRGWS